MPLILRLNNPLVRTKLYDNIFFYTFVYINLLCILCTCKERRADTGWSLYNLDMLVQNQCLIVVRSIYCRNMPQMVYLYFMAV